MQELKSFLNRFHKVEENDFVLLLNKVKPKSFKKGEVILFPGEIQRDLYFITKGVQMSSIEKDHKSHVIAFTYAPGLCAVPESFLFQAPSPCILSCLSDTSAWALSYENLNAALDASHSLERLFRRMDEAILSGFINRHIELHALTIEQRFKSFCARSPHLLQVVPHKYIASYLGIDPTNFSKLYNSIKI